MVDVPYEEDVLLGDCIFYSECAADSHEMMVTALGAGQTEAARYYQRQAAEDAEKAMAYRLACLHGLLIPEAVALLRGKEA